jgi:hypothetical protein
MSDNLVSALQTIRSLIKNHPDAAIEETDDLIAHYNAEVLPSLKVLYQQYYSNAELVDEYKTWFGDKSPTRLHTEFEDLNGDE